MAKNLRETPHSITFPCIKATQPIGTFYVCSIPAVDLCAISYFDVRRRLQEQRDVERYLGIQRPLNDKRVSELQTYVTFFDATFPTSIIVAVDERCAKYDEATSRMTLSNVVEGAEDEIILFRKIARVLDGQHRIAGLFDSKGTFDLSVSLFVGIDIADQAQIFSTVNLEQTKVSKSLAYDLFALARSRSPQKTCHNVAVALDLEPASPFYERIKRLGVATEGRIAEPLSQATFVEGLLKYLSRQPKLDRDVLLRGQKLEQPESEESLSQPLRTLFVAEKDAEIAQIVWNYFDAIKRRWPAAWDAGGRGLMLARTNGFRAAMRVFGRAYLSLVRPGEVPTADQFFRLFQRSKLKDDDFNTVRFPPGSSGESLLANTWIAELQI